MRSIVVASSDRSTGYNIQNHIKDSRWPVDVFESGKELFDYIRKNKVLLVVTTTTLSDMSGYSICNRIKKDSKLKDIPVFLILNDNNREPFDQHKTTAQKADWYFDNPSDIVSISSKIIDLVGRPTEDDLADKDEIAMAVESAIDVATFTEKEESGPPPIPPREIVIDEMRHSDEPDEWKKRHDIDRHEAKLQYLRDSLKKRELEINRLKSALSSKDDLISHLEQDLVGKDQSIEQINLLKEQLEAKVRELEQSLSYMTNERDDFKAQFEQVVLLKEESEKENAERISDRDRAIDEIQNALIMLQQEKEELERSTTDIIAGLNGKIGSLEQELADTKNTMAAEIKSRDEIIAEKEGRIESLINELNSTIDEKERQAKDAADHIESLNNQIIDLQQRLSDTIDERKRYEEEKIREVADLNGRIESLMKEIEDLTKEKNFVINELEGKITELEKTLADTQQLLSITSEQKAQLEMETSQRIGHLEGEVADRNRRIESLEHELQRIGEEYNNYQTEKRQEIEGLHSIIDGLNQGIADRDSSLSNLEATLRDLREEKSQIERESNEEIERLTQELNALIEKYNILDTKHNTAVDNYEKTIAQLKAKHIKEMEDLSNQYKEEINELQVSISQKDEALREMEDNYEFVNKQLVEESRKTKKAKDDALEMVNEIKKISQNRETELLTQISDLQNKVREFERVAREKERMATEYQRKFEDQKRTNEMLKRSLDAISKSRKQ